jgi:hypothetical protein
MVQQASSPADTSEITPVTEIAKGVAISAYRSFH